MNDKPNNSLLTVTAYLMAIALIIKLSIAFWTINRGFDLTDEGFNLLLFNYPEDNAVNVHNVQYFIHFLYGWFPIDLISLRIGAIVAELLGGLVFCWGFYAFCKEQVKNDSACFKPVLFYLFCFNAILLSVLDRMLSYNVLSGFFIYSAAGLWLKYLSGSRKRTELLIFFAALFLGFQLFIKPSSSIAMLILLLGVSWYLSFSTFRKALLPSIGGVVLAIAIFLGVLIPDVTSWYNNYTAGLQLASVAGYGSMEMVLNIYLIPGSFLLLKLAVSLLLFVVVYKRIGNRISAGRTVIISYFLSLSCFLLMFILGDKPLYDEIVLRPIRQIYFSYIFLLIHLAAVLFIMKYFYNPINEYEKNSGVLYSMIAIPFIIFFGAFAGIQVSLFGYLLPVLAVLYFLTISISRRYKYVLLAIILLVTGICTFSFYRNYCKYPLRQLSPLFQQNISLKGNDQIMTDEKSGQFISGLQEKLKPYDNEYVLHIGNQPGLVYLLGKRQPGTAMYISVPFYTEIEKMNLAYNRYFYHKENDRISRSVLLVNAGVHRGNMAQIRKIIGNYSLADSIYNPYLQKEMAINKLIVRPYTYIFVPADQMPSNGTP